MAWNWKPGVPADDVKLTAATVAFHTNDEDKDNDTKVTVVVRNWDRTEVARVSDYFGHFDDNHDNGPFSLFILNQTTVEKLKANRGEVAMHIDPNGHDTWRFNIHVELRFSDGSSATGEVNDAELSQNYPDLAFPIA